MVVVLAFEIRKEKQAPVYERKQGYSHVCLSHSMREEEGPLKQQTNTNSIRFKV